MKNNTNDKELYDGKISFIIPAMNEEHTIEALYQGISEQVQGRCPVWEVIFIDDGSTDATWEKISKLAIQSTLHVRAFRFGINRGKSDALALGYSKATGDIVFTMDADLQDDPREIKHFIEKLEEGYDVVTGWKKKRYDPWHKVMPSRVFNAAISKISGVKLHDHNCGFKAYRKEVVKRIPMYGDMHRMIPSLAAFKGFKTAEIEVEHHAREFGVSKYGWSRIIVGLMDMTTVGFLKNFRDCPMHFAGKIAGLLVILGFSLMVAAGVASLLNASAGVLFLSAGFVLMTAIIVTTQGLMLEQQVYTRMKEGRDIQTSENVNPGRVKVAYEKAKIPHEERFQHTV